MSKKSLNKKFWVLIESNNKFRCFVSTDVRNTLNVLVRFNPSFELIGIYDQPIDVSGDNWVDKSPYNGSEPENLAESRRNHANKEILLQYNSFEVAEIKYFAFCADNRIYIRKNEFEEVKWNIKSGDLKYGEIEHPMFVKDSDVGDYDLPRYYNAYKLNKLVGGVEISGWVIISDRQKNKNDSKK